MKKNKSTNEAKIVAAMDAVSKTLRVLTRFSAKYDKCMDEAAILGNNARAKELIRQKNRVSTLIKLLENFESYFELGAFTSSALSELGKLPAALAGCKGLLAESPDFTKLAKSITSIFGDIDEAEAELKKLNDMLSPSLESSKPSRLESVAEEEESDEFKAEYAAMIERIKHKVAPEAVAAPDATRATLTGDIDYEGIVSEENKRK